jgi:hypothetical protein
VLHNIPPGEIAQTPLRRRRARDVSSDVAVAGVSAGDLDAVVVPGGWARISSAGTTRSPGSSAKSTTKGKRRVDLPRGAGWDLGRHRGRPPGDGEPRDQGRPGQRRSDLGGRARTPRREPGQGTRRGGRPGLLPRAVAVDTNTPGSMLLHPPVPPRSSFVTPQERSRGIALRRSREGASWIQPSTSSCPRNS